MPTEKKENQVRIVQDKLDRAAIAITTEFRGVTVTQMAELRRQLRAKGVEYLVVKNALASIAADNVGKEGLRGVLKGPTAIAFGYEDVVDPAKVLTDHIRASRVNVTISGAVMGSEVLDAQDVQLFGGDTAEAGPPRSAHGEHAGTHHRPGICAYLSHRRLGSRPGGAAATNGRRRGGVGALRAPGWDKRGDWREPWRL